MLAQAYVSPWYLKYKNYLKICLFKMMSKARKKLLLSLSVSFLCQRCVLSSHRVGDLEGDCQVDICLSLKMLVTSSNEISILLEKWKQVSVFLPLCLLSFCVSVSLSLSLCFSLFLSLCVWGRGLVLSL